MGDVILVVEDNRELAAAVSELLALQGHPTVVVHDGRAAMDRLRGQRFSVILSDVDLPVVDGRELFRIIREQFPYYRDRLIYMTAGVDPRFRATLADAGIPLLHKPFEFDDLVAAIHQTQSRRVDSQEPPIRIPVAA